MADDRPPLLADRIGAFTPAHHPSTDGHTWRPAARDDVDELLAFHADVARADHPNWVETRDEVLELFELSHIAPAADTLIALDADGRILASGSVLCPPGRETLVTQMYVVGEPLNERDGLYGSLRDPRQRAAVTVRLEPANGIEAGALGGVFDIVLA